MNKKLIPFFAIFVILSAAVLADPAWYPANAYNGVPQIGAYYQASRTFAYNYQPVYTAPATTVRFSDYPDNYYFPARAGGWYGTSTEWLMGLRAPVNTYVAPVRYTTFATPFCGSQCWYGGYYGYGIPSASNFDFRDPGFYGLGW